ncbi:MAG: fibronectin type III domain-containing protein [Thermoplasmatota archaeon]
METGYYARSSSIWIVAALLLIIPSFPFSMSNGSVDDFDTRATVTWQKERVDELLTYTYFDMVRGSDGTIHAVSLVENRTGSYYDHYDIVYGIRESGRWSFEILGKNLYRLERCRIGLDRDGDVHIFYYDKENQDLKHMWRPPRGWMTENVFQDVFIDRRINFAFAPNGDIHVVFRGESSKEGVHWSVKTTTWTDILIYQYGYDPDVEVDDGGNVHLVYVRWNLLGRKGVRYGYSEGTGTTYSTIEPLANNETKDVYKWYEPDLVIDHEGDPNVLVRGMNDSDADFSKLTMVSFKDGNWSRNNISGWDMFLWKPSLFNMADGTWKVFCVNTTNWEYAYTRSYTFIGGEWTREMVAPYMMVDWEVDMDTDGNFHILQSEKEPFYRLMTFIIIGEPTVPGPPSDLSYVHQDGGADIFWEEAVNDGGSSILEYNIYREEGTGSRILVGSAPRSELLMFSDSGLEGGQTYTYYIRTVTTLGESINSPPLVVNAIRHPDPPVNVRLETQRNGINISWDPPEFDGGSSITNYRILWWYDDDTIIRTYDKPASTTYDNNYAKAGEYVNIAVRAENLVGWSENSTIERILVGIPPNPPILEISTGIGHVNILLRKTSGNGLEVISHMLHKINGSVENITEIDFQGGSTWRMNDTDIQLGVNYTYFATATNMIGESEPSEIFHVLSIDTPSPPQDFEAMPGDGEVVLSWEPPDHIGGAEIIEYVLVRNPDSALPVVFSIDPDRTEFIDDSVKNGERYTYLMRARNAAGNSTCATTSEMIPAGVPGIPGTLTAEPGSEEIVLRWGVPSYTGDVPLTGFKLYRVVDYDQTELMVNDYVTQYRDRRIKNGSTYEYYVVCYNHLFSSQNSNRVYVEVPPLPSVDDDDEIIIDDDDDVGERTSSYLTVILIVLFGLIAFIIVLIFVPIILFLLLIKKAKGKRRDESNESVDPDSIEMEPVVYAQVRQPKPVPPPQQAPPKVEVVQVSELPEFPRPPPPPTPTGPPDQWGSDAENFLPPAPHVPVMDLQEHNDEGPEGTVEPASCDGSLPDEIEEPGLCDMSCRDV